MAKQKIRLTDVVDIRSDRYYSEVIVSEDKAKYFVSAED